MKTWEGERAIEKKKGSRKTRKMVQKDSTKKARKVLRSHDSTEFKKKTAWSGTTTERESTNRSNNKRNDQPRNFL